MTAADLAGRYLLEPDGTVWHDGPLTLAVRYGAICYLDEIVEARQDTTVVIHPLTDARRILPLEKHNEIVAAHPDFQLDDLLQSRLPERGEGSEGIDQAALRRDRFRLSGAGRWKPRSSAAKSGADRETAPATLVDIALAVAQFAGSGPGGRRLHPHADPCRASGRGRRRLGSSRRRPASFCRSPTIWISAKR